MAWPLLGRGCNGLEKEEQAQAKEVKSMPRLPWNGPSGQLRSDILIGKAGEFELRPAVSQTVNSSLPHIAAPSSARLSRCRASTQADGALRRTCLSSRTHWRAKSDSKVPECSEVGELSKGLQRVDHVHHLLPLYEDGMGDMGTFASSNRADDEWPDQNTLESLGVPQQTAALMAGTSSSRSLFSTQTSSCASLADSGMQTERRWSRSDANFAACGTENGWTAWNFKKSSGHSFGKGTPWSTRSTARTPRTLQPLSKALSQRSLTSEVVVLKGESQPWVLDRLRACFHHSYAEILAKLIDLERALTVSGGETELADNPSSEGAMARRKGSEGKAQAKTAGEIVHHADNLQAAFETSGLESWTRPGCESSEVKKQLSMKTASTAHFSSLRATALSQELGASKPSEVEEIEADRVEEVAISTDMEVSRSLDMLRFVRWLCGLSMIDNNVHLEAVCKVLCEVLQPLQPPPGVRSSRLGDPPGLGHFVKEFLATQMGQVSVLHGEGSLVDAVEQGLWASHGRPWPPPVPVQPTQRRETLQRLQHHGFQQRQVGFMQQKAKLIEKQQKHIKDRENHQKDKPEERQRHFTSTMVYDEPKVDEAPALSSGIFGAFQPILHGQKPSDRCEETTTHSEPTSSALCRGDPEGAFAVRRKLLSPSLRGFGAYRRHDTSVLWTGCSVVGAGLQGCSDNHVDAVCYPPCGWVPAYLLRGWKTGWTIMPNSFRYGPTVQTSVKVWQVKIDFADGMPLAVERVAEVPVKGLAIDCAAHGEPFCIVFWPDALHLSDGMKSMVGIEVLVTGMTGPVSELSFYYQVAPFRSEDMYSRMLQEVRRLFDVAAHPRLWPGCSLPMEMPPHRFRRASEFFRKPVLEPMSHPSMDIIADGVDLLVTVRGCVRAVKAEFHVVRFGGETDIVPRAAQAQRLPNWNFLIRVKIPLPRAKYQLRIKPNPMEDGASSLCYSVTFNESLKVPALLASLDEPLAAKFGYAPFSSAAQAHGVMLLSPLMYRIAAGTAYFLFYVDKALALQDQCDQQEKGSLTTLFSSRLHVAPQQSTANATQPKATKERRSPLQVVQSQVAATLGPYVQDSSGEIHLDLSVKEGKCVRRLRERADMPGFFEGYLTFGQVDAQSKVRLFMRLPGVDVNWTPRLVCEWLVCRAHGEPLPKGFT